jgi:hypothetical protein
MFSWLTYLFIKLFNTFVTFTFGFIACSIKLIPERSLVIVAIWACFTYFDHVFPKNWLDTIF